MTVKELRTLVDNLDEYIHISGGIERLKKTILHLAVSGQLVPQDPSEGTGQQLYDQIQAEKQRLIAEGKLKKQKPLQEITEDEIPFEIPLNWRWTRLGEIVETNIGLTYKPTNISDDGTPVLRSNNIRDGEINYDQLVKVSVDIPVAKMTKPGDLLICARNGSRRLVGKVGIIREEGFSFGAFMALVRSPHNEYIKLFLESSVFRQQLDGVETTTINQITQSNLRNFVIPLPSATEQYRIVARHQNLMQVISQLAKKYAAEQEERSKLVKSSLVKLSKGESTLVLDMLTDIIKTKSDSAQLRKTILHLAVSGKLVPQDPSEGTGQQLYDQIQAEKQRLIAEGKLKKQKPLQEITEDEIPFEIPKNWKLVRLGEVTNTVMGQSPEGKEVYDIPRGVPFYQGKTEFGQDNPVPRKWIKRPKKYAKQGSVLISVRAPVGGTNYANELCGIGRGLAAVHPLGKMPKEILRIVLDVNKNYLQSLSTGTTFAAISAGDLLCVPFALPPLAEQTRIAQKTTQFLNLITQLETYLED